MNFLIILTIFSTNKHEIALILGRKGKKCYQKLKSNLKAVNIQVILVTAQYKLSY